MFEMSFKIDLPHIKYRQCIYMYIIKKVCLKINRFVKIFQSDRL